jgi:hypothetical protein
MRVMFEILVLGAFLGFILLCAACSFGRSPQSGRPEITRPTAERVDGFGGAKGYDYSYTPTHRGGEKGPLPVGMRIEREKTETHKAFSERKEDEQPD